nr:hypothetical protein Iba_chr09aCG9580 [Ipomoea batatas]GMD33975.1 hypothetical protein Iba_chr09cCG7690 [Ipomoea batatas]GMD35674.1 hypothetical protein Iba_chr09dCG9150 [Ipomoea batatas]
MTNMSFTALFSSSASLRVSSFVSRPPPKKSIPEKNAVDFSLSSRGGNPHVLTYHNISNCISPSAKTTVFSTKNPVVILYNHKLTSTAAERSSK